MGCPRRQAHTRNQISRGDTASVFGCLVPLDRGGRLAWLAPNSPLFSQELDEWVEDSAVHVSQRQSNWFWIRDKKMNTRFVKLTCHTVGCSAQVDDPTAPQTGMYASLKDGCFLFVFCLLPIFWLSACVYSGRGPICDISIYTCWTLLTPEAISMLRHNLATETKKKKRKKRKMSHLWTSDAE